MVVEDEFTATTHTPVSTESYDNNANTDNFEENFLDVVELEDLASTEFYITEDGEEKMAETHPNHSVNVQKNRLSQFSKRVGSGVTHVGKFGVNSVTTVGKFGVNSVQTVGKMSVNSVTTVGKMGVSSVQTVGKFGLDSVTTVGKMSVTSVTTVGKGVTTGVKEVGKFGVNSVTTVGKGVTTGVMEAGKFGVNSVTTVGKMGVNSVTTVGKFGVNSVQTVGKFGLDSVTTVGKTVGQGVATGLARAQSHSAVVGGSLRRIHEHTTGSSSGTRRRSPKGGEGRRRRDSRDHGNSKRRSKSTRGELRRSKSDGNDGPGDTSKSHHEDIHALSYHSRVEQLHTSLSSTESFFVPTPANIEIPEGYEDYCGKESHLAGSDLDDTDHQHPRRRRRPQRRVTESAIQPTPNTDLGSLLASGGRTVSRSLSLRSHISDLSGSSSVGKNGDPLAMKSFHSKSTNDDEDEDESIISGDVGVDGDDNDDQDDMSCSVADHSAASNHSHRSFSSLFDTASVITASTEHSMRSAVSKFSNSFSKLDQQLGNLGNTNHTAPIGLYSNMRRDDDDDDDDDDASIHKPELLRSRSEGHSSRGSLRSLYQSNSTANDGSYRISRSCHNSRSFAESFHNSIRSSRSNRSNQSGEDDSSHNGNDGNQSDSDRLMESFHGSHSESSRLWKEKVRIEESNNESDAKSCSAKNHDIQSNTRRAASTAFSLDDLMEPEKEGDGRSNLNSAVKLDSGMVSSQTSATKVAGSNTRSNAKRTKNEGMAKCDDRGSVSKQDVPEIEINQGLGISSSCHERSSHRFLSPPRAVRPSHGTRSCSPTTRNNGRPKASPKPRQRRKSSQLPPLPLHSRAIIQTHPLHGELVTLLKYFPESGTYQVRLLGREARQKHEHHLRKHGDKKNSGTSGKMDTSHSEKNRALGSSSTTQKLGSQSNTSKRALSRIRVKAKNLVAVHPSATWASLTSGGQTFRLPITVRVNRQSAMLSLPNNKKVKASLLSMRVKIDPFPGLEQVIPVAKVVLKGKCKDWDDPRQALSTIQNSPSRKLSAKLEEYDKSVAQAVADLLQANKANDEIIIDPTKQPAVLKALVEFEVLKRTDKIIKINQSGDELAIYKVLFPFDGSKEGGAKE